MRKKLQVKVEDEKKLCMKNSLPLAECIFFSEFIFLFFLEKTNKKNVKFIIMSFTVFLLS